MSECVTQHFVIDSNKRCNSSLCDTNMLSAQLLVVYQFCLRVGQMSKSHIEHNIAHANAAGTRSTRSDKAHSVRTLPY